MSGCGGCLSELALTCACVCVCACVRAFYLDEMRQIQCWGGDGCRDALGGGGGGWRKKEEEN